LVARNAPHAAGRGRRWRGRPKRVAAGGTLTCFSPPHPHSSTTRYQAHDADGKASLGDVVRLDPIRPMSKTKRFAVAEVVKKGE